MQLDTVKVTLPLKKKFAISKGVADVKSVFLKRGSFRIGLSRPDR